MRRIELPLAGCFEDLLESGNVPTNPCREFIIYFTSS
jgi:hypothetical protein